MSFDTLGLTPDLLTRVAEQGYTAPTPIQTEAIPHVLRGRDLMGLAQTGTGKTAAFGLPLVQLLNAAGWRPAPKSAKALILAPTRELARQISDTLNGFLAQTRLNTAMVVGGTSINAQVKRMSRGTDILVATPGRLLDLLDRRAIDLGQTQFLVLDEADQMLDMGFIHALRRIAGLLPRKRQTLLFSATMPKQMAEIAAAYLTDPVRVEVAPPGRAADKIAQSVHFVPQGEKSALLKELLSGHPNQLALVFSRTKHGAERLMKSLVAAGFAADSIHGNKNQNQRDRALAAFRQGRTRVLVATDVAARGIDIPEVRHVYNYDLPNVAENYVHRIGRTARAGAHGAAIAFCTKDEMGALRDIEKVMGRGIEVAGGTPWAVEPPRKQQAQKRGNGGGGRRRSRSRSGGQRKAA